MKHRGTTELSTARLLLRRYRPGDSVKVFENWASDRQAARFWSWEPHADGDVTRGLIEKWIGEYSRDDYYNWAITLKSTGQPVGYIYLDEIDEEDRSAHVHFLLGSRWWNMGLMTEALEKVIEHALTCIGFEKIFSYHHTENPAAGRVMEKSGMQPVREEYRESGCERLSGIYRFYMTDKTKSP